MRRGLFAAAMLFAAMLGVIGEPARAQEAAYPNKPVRIIVDSAPGSATDVTLRILADRLSQLWNQQVVTLNHVGGGGSIAARVASQAAPDGYTLYMAAASTFTALAGAPGVAPNLPIVLPRDFIPIGFVSYQPMFIASKPGFVSTIPEMIAEAKKRPGEISYATTGRGRITHLTMELLQMRSGAKMQMVPYSGGPAHSMNDIMGGRVQIVIEGYSGLVGAVQGGLLKGLAISTLERVPDMPDVPTVAETLAGFDAGGWNVMIAPLGTPDAIVRKVAADLPVALGETETKAKLAKLGAFVRTMTPEQVVAFASEQQKMWKPVSELVAKQAH